MATDAQVIAELTRMKALFQLRVIAKVMDLPPSTLTPCHHRQNKDVRS